MAQYRGPQVIKEMTHEQLLELFAMLVKDLQFILNGHLNANNIQANSIETKNLKVGAVTAEKISVDELSAISANMGKLTSGEIYGAYIATGEGVYPRIEFSSSGNLMAAYLNPNQYIALSPSATGAPTYIFYDGGTQKATLSYISGVGLLLQALAGSITITPQTNLFLTAWNRIYNNSGQTLQQVFDSKANNFSGANASLSVVTGVNFATQTASYAFLNFENGILKSVIT
ncbi:hypothetical protein PV433_25895 [Paenibacillus sp. GYB004]|uniref:hypothetical protein n=1 Tax=Paenibacillus sp. GYB004 TaxID=2994393 RepID=UPI002F96E0B8